MIEIWPGHPGGGHVVRGHAVPGLELPRTVARRRHRGHRVAGLAGPVPQVWKPKKDLTSTTLKGHENDLSDVPDLASEKPVGHEADAGAAIFAKNDRRAVVLAWLPWLILSVFVSSGGIPGHQKALDGISVVRSR